MTYYDDTATGMNPYHYIRECLLGKWKMTLLHHIHNYGTIRFNQTLQILPVSEKVLSQQLKELCESDIIKRIVYDTSPPKVEYVLTDSGMELIEILDKLFIWGIKGMKRHNIEIDADAFVVHNDEKYITELIDFIDYDQYLNKAERAKAIDLQVKAKRNQEKNKK